MKKTIVVFICLASFVMTFFSIQKDDVKVELLLADIEVLAQGELPEIVITCSASPFDGYGQCYKNISYPWSKDCIFTGYQYDYCSYSVWVR